MKIAIMQPYFFPYIGQFNLIHAVDRFILCDDVQYIRHGWINRNRILKYGEGNQYIIAPIAKHKSNTPIRDIRIADGTQWKNEILKQIEHYRKKSPWFTQVRDLLFDCLAREELNIARLNANCLKAVCDYIGLEFSIELSSGLPLDYSGIVTTEDWALQICRQLGASDYYNPPGGMELYDRAVFRRQDLGLHFVKPVFEEYDQGRQAFEPGLSIIDIMMFNSPGRIREMLNNYQVL
jgi:hypothetical protein